MQMLRSILFVFWMYTTMVVIGLFALPTLWLPLGAAFRVYKLWLGCIFWGLKVFCRLGIKVEGLENIPEKNFFLASKHHSMVDVLLPWKIFKNPAIILKKELTYLPFFGWYAVKLQNIVIDRKAGARALKGMVQDAKLRTEEGRPVLIFPEGTRVSPGEKQSYKPGVAALYQALGVECLPVSHNAGAFWPAKGVLRKPGVITVRILPPIPAHLPRKVFMQRLETEIENTAIELLSEENLARK